MANHVSSCLRFNKISEEGRAVLNKMFERFDQYKQDGRVHLGFTYVDDLENTDQSEMCDRIGAKWAYAEDWHEDGISMESAWSPCEAFVEELVTKIGEVDPDVQAIYTYEDEGPNFIGAYVYDSEGLYDGCEIDDNEMTEHLLETHQELREVWDADDEEWTDDGDMYYDYLWGFVNEWQENMIDDMLDSDS